jgi:glycosyltransferase involved in cell wall biosynthesis
LSIFKLLGWHKRFTWHSTDVSETTSIRKVFNAGMSIKEVVNIPIPIHEFNRGKQNTGLVFISRVSPKKNLHFFIERMLEARIEDFPLTIIGPEDDGYAKNLRSLAGSLNVDFCGPLAPTVVSERLAHFDFLVLPTLNENFGHAIIEALSHGCPVIISDKTPWNDLEEAGAGWVIPLDNEQRWVNVLHAAAAMNDVEYRKMSIAARDYVKRKFDLQTIKQQYLELFTPSN